MPYDPHLADRMRAALRDQHDIQEKKMIGGLCWMLHGNMLCGAGAGYCLFRVGDEGEETALGRPGATRMEMAGKPMPGFVRVSADHAEGEELRQWIETAARFVETLPPK
jgi:hypothetical protein